MITLLVIALFASIGIVIINQTYLYNPFTIPKPIVSKSGFTYDWFSKPVRVEVFSYDKSSDYMLNPVDKKKYDEYAREMTDFYAQILDQSNVTQTNYGIGMVGIDDTVYQMYLFTKKCTLLTLELAEHGEFAKVNNSYYTITPGLRDAIIHHIQKIYTVKKAR